MAYKGRGDLITTEASPGMILPSRLRDLFRYTLLKFNIAPESRPSQKETHLRTIFQGLWAMLNFGGVLWYSGGFSTFYRIGMVDTLGAFLSDSNLNLHLPRAIASWEKDCPSKISMPFFHSSARCPSKLIRKKKKEPSPKDNFYIHPRSLTASLPLKNDAWEMIRLPFRKVKFHKKTTCFTL